MSKVTVYFDLICPYCYLGRGFWLEMQKERPVESEWIPWELNPDLPPGGSPVAPERQKARIDKLRELAGGYRAFSDEPNAFSASSRNALLGLEFARAQGKAEDYIERFFAAYYRERVNISTIDEVTRLGAEVGLNAKALRASVESREYEDTLARNDRDAEAMGLEVMPSYTSDGRLLMAGSVRMDFNEFRAQYLSVF